MPIARKPAKVSNYKFMCTILYIIENGCKWRALPKKYGKWHTVYVKFNRWFKNGTIAKSYGFFFFKTLSSVAMKKQKLLNEWDSVLFIDSASIKASPDANENRNGQKQSIRCSKKG